MGRLAGIEVSISWYHRLFERVPVAEVNSGLGAILCAHDDLAEWLKLKWVKARVSQGLQHCEYPDRVRAVGPGIST